MAAAAAETVREVVAPYEAAVEELKREVKAKESEAEELREKVKCLSVENGKKNGRSLSRKKGSLIQSQGESLLSLSSNSRPFPSNALFPVPLIVYGKLPVLKHPIRMTRTHIIFETYFGLVSVQIKFKLCRLNLT